jgi:hypothetical protein
MWNATFKNVKSSRQTVSVATTLRHILIRDIEAPLYEGWAVQRVVGAAYSGFSIKQT